MRGLWLRGDTYWFRGTLPERGQVRFSLNTTDYVEAIGKAREVFAFPDRFGNKAETDSVEKFLKHQERRGISKARIDLSRIVLNSLASMAAGKIENVSQTMASRWWSATLARVKAKSAKDYLGVCTVFYRWAIDAGFVKSSPIALIIPPKVRPTPRRIFLKPEDALKILDNCEDKDLKFCLYCALHCGLRRGEVIAARTRWFDLKQGTLHVQNEKDWLTKDRDNRSIPITKEFQDFLKGYGMKGEYAFRPDKPLQPTNRTWRYRTDFAKSFNNYMEVQELKGVTFHDLRRTFASLHASKGTPLFHIARWLGDDPSVVEKTYAHLLPNDQRINDPWVEARGGVK